MIVRGFFYAQFSGIKMTKEDIQAIIDFYITAEMAVLNNQSIKHGEKMLTLADLTAIRAGRKEWQQKLALLSKPNLRKGYSVAVS